MSLRLSNNGTLALACMLLLLGGCSSLPDEDAGSDNTAVPSTSTEGSQKSAEPAQNSSRPAAPSAVGSAQPSGAPGQPIPPRARSDFDRAVGLMRAGNATEAELEFKQLSTAYPQLTSPRINLAILQRKANRLDEAEATLKSAVEAQPANALAWNELGITLRQHGKFAESVDAYEHAIAADPNFAAAHRNLAVVLDLYVGDAERALTELERYKELTGEEKPVNGWIAELRQRTGKPAAPRPAATPPPADAAPAEGAPPAVEGAPTETAPAPAPTPPPQRGALSSTTGDSNA